MKGSSFDFLDKEESNNVSNNHSTLNAFQSENEFQKENSCISLCPATIQIVMHLTSRDIRNLIYMEEKRKSEGTHANFNTPQNGNLEPRKNAPKPHTLSYSCADVRANSCQQNARFNSNFKIEYDSNVPEY